MKAFLTVLVVTIATLMIIGGILVASSGIVHTHGYQAFGGLLSFVGGFKLLDKVGQHSKARS